jgi:thymidylate kinase
MSLIVFVGPDGSGKSTIARMLVDRTSSSVPTVNFRPRRVDRWMGKREMGVDAHSAPHATPRRSGPRTWLKFAVIVFDLMTLRWDAARAGRIGAHLVVERYVYDLMADPRRLGLEAIPRSFRAAATRLVQSPRRVFCFLGDPEAMHARKPELSVDEIQRQIEFWRAYAHSRDAFRLLNSTQNTPEELVNAVLDDLRKTS